MKYQRVLSYQNLSNSIKAAQYAVRGSIAIKALDYETALESGTKLPFEKITQLNVAKIVLSITLTKIGNPQQLGQPPISFIRKVLSCVVEPELMKKPIYHQDVINRAKQYLTYFPSVGVYTESQGIKQIRENIANYITERDGFPSSKDNIFLTNGAGNSNYFPLIIQKGDTVRPIMKLLIQNKFVDGVMISIPRYPLFSASIHLEKGKIVGYHLDESKNWQLNIAELAQQYEKATKEGTKIKALVVVNPSINSKQQFLFQGNPTGQILTKQNMQEILKFCYTHSLVLFVDEVYQTNVYDPFQQFSSFKKVLMEMGQPINNSLELISINSISKGLYGECKILQLYCQFIQGGLKGGYMELTNIEKPVIDQLLKLQSITLCANIMGQIGLDLVVNPPSKKHNCSDETISEYTKETQTIFNSLKTRAKIVTKYLKQCNNISTNDIYGSMYTFPQVKLSSKAIQTAKMEGIPADDFYCHKCLDETGIMIVPGSGFGQVEDTYHFRMSILEYDSEMLEETMQKFKRFNDKFHQAFA